MAVQKKTIQGKCTLHPYARLICPVCAGRKGGRGRKGNRALHAQLLAVLNEAKAKLQG